MPESVLMLFLISGEISTDTQGCKPQLTTSASMYIHWDIQIVRIDQYIMNITMKT